MHGTEDITHSRHTGQQSGLRIGTLIRDHSLPSSDSEPLRNGSFSLWDRGATSAIVREFPDSSIIAQGRYHNQIERGMCMFED